MTGSGATLSAAAIGAAITVVSLMVSKENKTSEFRQQWIDALREDISAYLALATMLCRGELDKTKKDEHLLRLGELDCRIRLRFKRNDPDTKHLIAALNGVSSTSTPQSDRMEFLRHEETLKEAAQTVLKNEWERVKRGEVKYRIVLWCASIAFAASTATLVAWLVGLKP
jgi:hypothetical protein